MTEETEKRNSNKGFTTRDGRKARSISRLIQRDGYALDPEREAKRARVDRVRRQIIRDLGGAPPSRAQAILAASAAVFSVWLADHAEGVLSSTGVETREYVNMSRACTQTLLALGIQRRPRDAMTLDRYLKKAGDDSADDATSDIKRS